MLSIHIKIFIGTVLFICQIIAFISAHSAWYSDCLHVPRRTGTLILFTPLVTIILIGLLLMLKILPWEFSDELFTLGTTIGSILLVITIIQQFRGKCKSKCKIP
jgi:hypothetical protein